MAESFEYYEVYLSLRKHMNLKNFNYKKDKIKNPKDRWKFANKYDRYAIKYFREKYSLKEFKKFVLANLIEDTKIKLPKLKKIGYDNYKNWCLYKQNSMYYFKKELMDYGYNFDEVFKKSKDLIKLHYLIDWHYFEEFISFDTLIYLHYYYNVYEKEEYRAKTDLEKVYINRINKYILLMNIDIGKIKQVIGEVNERKRF